MKIKQLLMLNILFYLVTYGLFTKKTNKNSNNKFMTRTLTQDLSIKQYFMFTDYMYLNLGSYV